MGHMDHWPGSGLTVHGGPWAGEAVGARRSTHRAALQAREACHGATRGKRTEAHSSPGASVADGVSECG
jgi:hypothetical protein